MTDFVTGDGRRDRVSAGVKVPNGIVKEAGRVAM